MKNFNLLVVLLAVGVLWNSACNDNPSKFEEVKQYKIAFLSNIDEDVWGISVMNGDGSDEKMLTDSFGGAYADWSPDGSRIAFSRGSDATAEIYVINVDGTNLQRLTNSTAVTVFPRWSPDGSKIAFKSREDLAKMGSAIFVMNADGTNIQRLTDPVGEKVLIWEAPKWSPDGSKILFSSDLSSPGQRKDTNIYTVNADGSNLKQLTDIGRASNPDWSPGGGKIVFTAADSNLIDDIYVISASGGNPESLTRTPIGEYMPIWSPDGAKIVYTISELAVWNIWVMNADGTEQRQITDSPGTDGEPAWSPDGEWIAFSSSRDDVANQFQFFKIYIMRPDGSEQRRLTNRNLRDLNPVWSPVRMP